MDTVLPIALIKINIFWLPVAGFFIGFATGMFGVGGGIIAVPAMLSLGIAPFIAVANSIAQAIGTTFSGALTQYKKGNLNLKIAFYLIVSGLLGGYFGVKLVGFLEKSGDFDKFFDYVFYSFLLYTGISLVLTNFKKVHLKPKKDSKLKAFFKKLPYQIVDAKTNDTIPTFIVCLLGFFTGILSSIAGLGGGIVIVPILSFFFPKNFNLASAASLAYIGVVCSIITFFNVSDNQNVDIFILTLLLSGSVAGAQLGVLAGEKLGPRLQKLTFGFLILIEFSRKILKTYKILDFGNGKKTTEVLSTSDFSFTVSNFAHEQKIFYFVLIIFISIFFGLAGKTIFTKKQK
ncbi:sulfite exporter TauE/SafE family protein [bacterium]|nr:sulfite exporter TauE/SafE family protein [bacterium]